MGALAATEIDVWLREGGLVVTASDRAARSLATSFHRARRAEGLTAWPAPNILDWKSFARTAWEKRGTDGRLLLNPAQEQALWVKSPAAGPLTWPRCSKARDIGLRPWRWRLTSCSAPMRRSSCGQTARDAWQQDAATFSGWLEDFDETCRAGNLISPSRLPHELIPLLKADPAQRPPLLLAGFDRILPVQRSLFDAWGEWREAAQGEPASEVHFHAAADAQAELAACAIWCSRRLAADPSARLLVVAQAASTRRGEIERAFLAHYASAAVPLSSSRWEFLSASVGLARAAYLVLRWLDGPLDEHELDWLLSTGHAADSSSGICRASLLYASLAPSQSGTNRMDPGSLSGPAIRARSFCHLPGWSASHKAQRRLAEFCAPPAKPARLGRARSPTAWTSSTLPSAHKLTSAEYQALRRWQQAVESCGSLGFDGRRDQLEGVSLSAGPHTGRDALCSRVARRAHPDRRSCRVGRPHRRRYLVPGRDEDAWPASGATHPLLPIEIQREAGMPHATPQLDWELARIDHQPAAGLRARGPLQLCQAK